MELVPIKLLKNGPVKRSLLNISGESAKIDMNDFLESRIKTVELARKLMAVEDASEMAKKFLQVDGLFEKMGDDIRRETGKDFTFTCKNPGKSKTPLEYVLMEWKANGADFGHYGMARVEHGNEGKGKALVYDSMTNIDSSFANTLKRNYGSKYKVTTKRNLGKPQPTGGEVMNDLNLFKQKYKNLIKGLSKETLENAFLLSQFDELSQHHFCYVESFISMMIDLGMANPGPKDPRLRLAYVKYVAWALIHKYVPKSQRNTPQWKYFVTNFPYIITTRTSNNKLLGMRMGEFQVLPKNGDIKFGIKKLALPTNVDNTWSFKKIMNRAYRFVSK
jgi:hypothetical protein